MAWVRCILALYSVNKQSTNHPSIIPSVPIIPNRITLLAIHKVRLCMHGSRHFVAASSDQNGVLQYKICMATQYLDTPLRNQLKSLHDVTLASWRYHPSLDSCFRCYLMQGWRKLWLRRCRKTERRTIAEFRCYKLDYKQI